MRLQCNNSTEVWTLCGCSESCADQGTQLICPTECPSTGYCACKEGFAKNSNGQCIPQSECPNPSGCPSGAKPPSSFCDPCTRATCPGQPGAECKYCGRCGEAKYFLNGQDVTRLCHQNQPECKPDEELRIGCGSACPPQCGDETMGPCMPLCQPKCICKYGLVRGPNGCIRREECKNLPKCDAIATCPNGTHCIDTNFGAQCVRKYYLY